MQADRPDLSFVCFEGKRLPVARRRTVRGRAAAALRPSPAAALARAVRSELPRPGSEADAARDDFARWVLARAGLDAAIYRQQPLGRRVAACLRALKARNLGDARELLEKLPHLAPAATSALLIGVTDFFRDPRVFDDIRTSVLPALAARAGTLRVWSAACSSGLELYSVAMLLAEAQLLHRSELVGTDCRPVAIAEACARTYPLALLNSVPAPMRERYFKAGPAGWRVRDTLSNRARWKVSDLGRTVEPGPWDVVLWRNVGIYWNAEPAERVARRLVEELRPGGFLVVGKAERPPASLALVPVRRCIFRKAGDA